MQGVDYAYTLQGWLKGVNSTNVNYNWDMGRDGGQSNMYVARDVYGFALHYYNNDYLAVNNSKQQFADAPPSGNKFKPLYNGNIAAMSVNLKLAGVAAPLTPLLYSYKYDQLNRLKQMQPMNGLDSTNNAWNPVAIKNFMENIKYDDNGNILRYDRYPDGTAIMDSLTYNYVPGTNKLAGINDAVTNDSAFTGDIDNQTVAANYLYDGNGNQVKDKKEGIDTILWNVYGKIKQVTKGNVVTTFTYDAAGNRISKIVNGKETWYMRDAGGNIMAVYNIGYGSMNGGAVTLSEQNLYGSSRLGIYKPNTKLSGVLNIDLGTPLTGLNSTGYKIGFERGRKNFELVNHLGNVLVTISDKKIGVDANSDTLINYYLADVVSASDYYPFGMQMPGRSYNVSNSAYGFNGKRKDNEIYGEGNFYDYGMRGYDPRAGRFWGVDPLTNEYPELTPYQYASNRPIDGIDRDGLEYSPAGLFGPNGPRDGTAVQLYPLNATQMQQKSAQIAARVNYLNQWVAAPDIYGNGQIGPRYAVQSNIASIKQNYYNAVGDNIAGGPFGAAGYLIAGDKGSFVGSSFDGIALSVGGIPGESSVLSKPTSLANSKTSNSIETTTYEHPPLNLSINLKPNWNKEQVTEAYNKAQAITNNLETKVTLKNPVQRQSNLRSNYLKQGGSLIQGQHLDHITDLQINGINNFNNLQGLNGSVNTSFGKQLNIQIRNVPDNTRVSTVTINPFIPVKK